MFHHASVPHSLTECYTLFVGGWNCLDLYQKLEKGGEGGGGEGSDQISPHPTKFSFNPHIYYLDQSYCTHIMTLPA